MSTPDPSPTVRTYGHEYRAVITCSEDPCTSCHAPRRSDVLGSYVFPSAAEAFAHGREIAGNYYYAPHGASTHDVTVQARAVAPWTNLAQEDQIRAYLDAIVAKGKARRG